jgi:hypothetical protein
MDNIERFNVLTAYVLGKLYREFPVGCVIVSDDVQRDLTECFPGDDGKEKGRFIGQALMWLEETGYVLTRRGGVRKEYVLAPRAFEAMMALPSALKGEARKLGEKSVGEQLVEATKGFGKEVGTQAKSQIAAQLVGQVIGWAMKTAIGPSS